MCFNFVKKELKSYNLYKATVKDLEIRLNSVDNELTYISAKQLNEVNVHTNKFNSSVENTLIEKEHVIHDLEKQKKIIETKINRIDNSLSILTEREKDILIDVYIKQLKYSRLEQKYFITYSRIKQIEKQALNKIKSFFTPTTTVYDFSAII